MLTTFGGSGSLLACRLVDILDLAGVVVPPNPGNVSAFGLLTVDVKNDYVQTHVAKESALDHAAVQSILDTLTDRAREALGKEGFADGRAPVPPHHRRALRRPGLRGAGRRARGRRRRRLRRAGGRRVPRRPPPALRLRLPRRPDPAGRVGQPPRHRHRADHPPGDPDAGQPRRVERTRPGHRDPSASTPTRAMSTPRSSGAPTSVRATPSAAPPSWRSSAPRSPSTPASRSWSTTGPTS